MEPTVPPDAPSLCKETNGGVSTPYDPFSMEPTVPLDEPSLCRETNGGVSTPSFDCLGCYYNFYKENMISIPR